MIGTASKTFVKSRNSNIGNGIDFCVIYCLSATVSCVFLSLLKIDDTLSIFISIVESKSNSTMLSVHDTFFSFIFAFFSFICFM